MNKVSTSAQLRKDMRASAALAPEVKARLLKLAGSESKEIPHNYPGGIMI